MNPSTTVACAVIGGSGEVGVIVCGPFPGIAKMDVSVDRGNTVRVSS